jgi:pimeloyl-ACP methyl ester carboxylesterase
VKHRAGGTDLSGFLLRLVGGLLMVTALAVALMRAPDRSVESLVLRWAPPPSDFMDLKGQLVHLRDEGPRNDPLPILLLHGTGSSLHTWEGWVRGLRGQRRVISIDLPGFGLTGPFAGAYAGWRYRPEEYARFVLELMQALNVPRFVIAGHSLGGEVAWRTAAAAPKQVERLVLVSAGGYPAPAAQLPLGMRLAQLPGAAWIGEQLLPRAVIVDSVRDVYGDPTRVTDALVDRYFELTLRQGNRRALAERMAERARPGDPAPIATLRLPTLVIWGGRDRLIPPENAQRFQRDIQGSQRVVLEPLGHVPHEEDPAASLAPVKAFLGLTP